VADDKDAHGMLLKRFLDAEISESRFEGHDILERAEASFEKSREEEQKREADFAEWVKETSRQPHEEFEYEYDPMESPTPMHTDAIAAKQSDTHTELILDLQGSLKEEPSEPVIDSENDEFPLTDAKLLLSELETSEELSADQRKEKIENAERPL